MSVINSSILWVTSIRLQSSSWCYIVRLQRIRFYIHWMSSVKDLLVHWLSTLLSVRMRVMMTMSFFSLDFNWNVFFSTENFLDISTSKDIFRINRLIFEYSFDVAKIFIHQVRNDFKRRMTLRLVNRLNCKINTVSECLDHEHCFIEQLFGLWIGKLFKVNNFRIGFLVRVVHKSFNSLLHLSDWKYRLTNSRNNLTSFAYFTC